MLDEFTITFGDVVRIICKYPNMYLMNGSFGEALAFLEGYAKGGNLGGRISFYFIPFEQWLCSRHGWKETEDFWRTFRDTYGEDQIALNEFARLWSEYEADHSANEDIG